MKAEWFAGRLRELREAAGLTQQQLAERAGMAWRTITHLEGGNRKPSWETVIARCQALGVDCGEFAKEPAPRPQPGPGRPRRAPELTGPVASTPAKEQSVVLLAGNDTKQIPLAQHKPRQRKTGRPRECP